MYRLGQLKAAVCQGQDPTAASDKPSHTVDFRPPPSHHATDSMPAPRLRFLPFKPFSSYGPGGLLHTRLFLKGPTA